MGYLLLEGGAEFSGQMAEPDRQAMAAAGGPDAMIAIIPAAAAPDNNHQRAGQMGLDWFHRLEATNVSVLPLIDNSSANDPAIAAAILHSKLIYLLGGFPHYLARVLMGSRCWQSILTVFHSGAVIAGSSAGAMVLCENYYDPTTSKVNKGLNLVKHTCILPHHDTFGKEWAPRLRNLLPDTYLLGIDEKTGVLNDASQNTWQVYGKGKITLYHGGQVDKFDGQQAFDLQRAVGSPGP